MASHVVLQHSTAPPGYTNSSQKAASVCLMQGRAIHPSLPTVALHTTHSALLILGAHSLQQLLDFSIMLHGLMVPVTEEILQHFLLVLETQAQLLCYLTLSWAQLAQQSSCKLLNKEEEGRDGETLLPSNCKLFKDEQLFSLGVAESSVSASTGIYRCQKQPTSKAPDTGSSALLRGRQPGGSGLGPLSLQPNWLKAQEAKLRPYLHFLVPVMQAGLQLLDDSLLLLLPAAGFGLDLLLEPAEVLAGC